MNIREARKLAIKNAAEWVGQADWDQFWGDELADAAFGNDRLAAVMAQAQREIAARIQRLAGSASGDSNG